jgi:methyltransferase (TIGR00027 family)
MRPDHDDWDITTGVGLTALGVAAARSIETHRPDGLVRDPYAEAFVQAAAVPVPMPTRPPASDGAGGEPAVEAMWGQISDYVGVRSRFFDDYLTGAVAAGVKQAVLLAAGLDTRAFRLDWPGDATVYEVDRSQVLAFKDEVLTARGARSGATRRGVAIDLRADWPAALHEAGFDRTRPTAWLAEGLLLYLPAAAQETLLTRVHELSAPGSRIAIEQHAAGGLQAFADDPMVRTAADHLGADLAELWYDDPRRDPGEWLAEHGWSVHSAPVEQLASDYGRPLSGPTVEGMGAGVLIHAQQKS